MPVSNPPIISNTTPLAANAAWTSPVQNILRATEITGSVYADQPGTLQVQQSGDGTNWDLITTYDVPVDTGVSIQLEALEQSLRVIYTNGGIAQTAFRLYINAKDPFGTFLSTSQAPTAGGAYIVLFQGPGGYQVVGRFDGLDPMEANGNAAIYLNKNGQYAAFPVNLATVTVETIVPTTDFSFASF